MTMLQVPDFHSDFRTKDYNIRREAFIQWFAWSLKNKDCDPALFMTNYLFDRFEHNIEQRLWICWIYGTTYYFPTTWIIWNEFPDFELVGQAKLKDWNDKNYKRLRYQVDTKWNKGHLPEQYASYHKWVLTNHKSQREKIRSLYGDNEEESFWNIWNDVNKNLHKFGRYSTWFYMQTLRDCAGIKIEAPNLMLDDYSGSRSHRNGLLYALAKDELINEKLDAKTIQWLEEEAQNILITMDQRFPELNAEFFGMETCLCSFRKIFRSNKIRYLGYYLARQAAEIEQVEKDGWDGIDWNPLWQSRIATISDSGLCNHRLDKNVVNTFLSSGNLQFWNTPSNLTNFFT